MLKGSFWVFSLRITNRIFDVLRIVILARLLAPGDFGLLGIAMLALSILSTFSEAGFEAALIQKREKTEQYLNTAWTFNIIKGALTSIVLFAACPLVGIFFNTPGATAIIRVLAITQLLRGWLMLI